jgi:two-component system sensor histidine kinase QseC
MAMPSGFPRPDSLVGRLLMSSAAALLAAAVIVGALILAGLQWGGTTLSERSVWREWEEVAAALVVDADGRLLPPALDPGDREVYDGLPKDVAFRIVDAANGRTLASSAAGPALQALAQQPVEDHAKVRRITHDGRVLYTLSAHVTRGDRRYGVQVTRSERMLSLLREDNAEMAAEAAALTSLLAVLVFGGIVLWTFRRLMGPVRAVSQAASRITPDKRATRLDPQPLPAELQPLIVAFNAALERLQHGYDVQQRFLASAAHELKTPLALLRAELELIPGVEREQLLADVDLLVRQVNQLLHLAEVSEQGNFALELTDLRPVVFDAVGFLSRLARRHEVDVQCETQDEPVMQRADASAVFVLLKNLGENAILHAGPARLVSIRLDATGLCVSDMGAGVAPEHVPHLFERFWRAPNVQRPGAGLGLAICAEIARAHGWRIRAENQSPGMAFRIRFD